MVFSAFFASFQKSGVAEKSSFSAIFAFIAGASKTPPNYVDGVFQFSDGRLAFFKNHIDFS
jgi:hypothetical protein